MDATCTQETQRRRHFDHELGNTVLRTLITALPQIRAAEELAQRLNEAGMNASPKSIPHDTGCCVLVYVTANLPSLLLWLDHYAVPISLLSQGSSVAITAYSAKVSGQDITLVITHRELT